MNRKTIYLTMIFGIFLLSTISGVKNQTYPDVKNPGQYIVEQPDLSYASLDTATNYETGGFGINSLICETLYDYNSSSLTELIPRLAASMPVVNAAGTQFNVTLKQGIHFTDGTEFNAWTYKYSIDRVMMISDPNSAAFVLSALKGGAEINARMDNNVPEAMQYLAKGAVKVISDYEIQFNLDYGYAAFIPAMTYQVGCAISPKFVVDHTQWGTSAFTPIPQSRVDNPSTLTVADNTTGMVRLNDWFPSLNGNYTKLGLNATVDPAFSGVVPSGIVDPCACTASQFWYGERHQVGTGPWKLTSFTATSIILDKNTAWHDASTFKTNSPDQIVVKAVTDGLTRATALQNGDADEARIDPAYFDQFVNPDGSPKLTTVQVFQKPSLDELFMGFNLRPADQLGTGYIDKYPTSSYCWDNQTALASCGIKGYAHWTQAANYTNPFTALNFRKAFAYATDYDAYIQNVSNGFGIRMEGLIPEGLLGHQNDLIQKGYIPTHDTAVAKALFQQMGWQGSITIPYNTGSTSRQVIATQLKNTIESLNVGIQINLLEMSWPTFLKVYYQVPLFLLGWAPDFADPDNYMTSFVHSTNGYYSARISYINPAVDPLLAQAAAETDTQQRILDYQNLERYIAEESIFLYMTQPITTYMSAYWIQDFEQSGSMNPMRQFTRVQFINKQPSPFVTVVPYTSSTSTTTPTTVSSSSTSISSSSTSNTGSSGTGSSGTGSSGSISSSSSTSSSVSTTDGSNDTSTQTIPVNTNGFEMITVIFLFSSMSFLIRKIRLRKKE